jgi:hypothetical protein
MLSRFGLAAALTLAVVAAMPLPAQACGCVPVVALPGQQTRPPSFDREVAIFSATVVEKSLLKATVTVLVEQVWKGELTYLTTMPILNWNNCEFSFEVGKTYLIFGLGDSIATMRAEKCTLTAPLDEAGEALELLKTAGYSPRLPRFAPQNR